MLNFSHTAVKLLQVQIHMQNFTFWYVKVNTAKTLIKCGRVICTDISAVVIDNSPTACSCFSSSGANIVTKMFVSASFC